MCVTGGLEAGCPSSSSRSVLVVCGKACTCIGGTAQGPEVPEIRRHMAGKGGKGVPACIERGNRDGQVLTGMYVQRGEESVGKEVGVMSAGRQQKKERKISHTHEENVRLLRFSARQEVCSPS